MAAYLQVRALNARVSVPRGEEVTVAKTYKMYIGGEMTDAKDGNTRTITSPATGEELGVVPESSAVDVDRAVEAAKRAFEETWSDATPKERMEALLKMADLVDQNADELGRLESENVGKPLAVTMSEEVPVISDQFRFFASGSRLLPPLCGVDSGGTVASKRTSGLRAMRF